MKKIKFQKSSYLILLYIISVIACKNLPSIENREIEKLKKDNEIATTLALISLANSSKSKEILTAARIRKSTSTTTINGTPLNISFDTVDYDTGNYFSSSTPDRITISSSGLYLILGQLTYAINTSGYRKVNLVLNDSSVTASTSVLANSGDFTSVSAQSISKLSSGDFIRLQAWQGSGGNLNIDVNSGYSQILTITKLNE